MPSRSLAARIGRETCFETNALSGVHETTCGSARGFGRIERHVRRTGAALVESRSGFVDRLSRRNRGRLIPRLRQDRNSRDSRG
jgi:hypothetical protein